MLERAMHQTAKAQGDDAIVLQLVQKPSRGAAISQFLLASPTLIAWIVPIVLCAQAAADPQTLDIISDRPFAAGQIALAFVGWSLIFGIPLVSLSKRIGASRSITINADTVRVADTSWLRTRHWSQPLAAYRGLGQRVRTTLSGLEHEVVLVHSDPAKAVVLAQSPPQRSRDAGRVEDAAPRSGDVRDHSATAPHCSRGATGRAQRRGASRPTHASCVDWQAA